MDRDDAECLERYRRGDVEALEALIVKYRRPLMAYIQRMVLDAGVAEEVFQDVWLRALKRLPRFKRHNLLGWLVRIAHNRVVDLARKHRPALTLNVEDENGTMPVERLEAPGSDPIQPLTDAEGVERIRLAVEDLPPEQREVFLLRAEADMTFREIARVQRVSINTALARMQYAVRKLRRVLGDEHEECKRQGSNDAPNGEELAHATA